MRIGVLSRRTGVAVRLLRYYEERGLLEPVRRPSGYREYREDDVRMVQNIRTLLAAGLSTRTIAGLLPCMVDDGQDLAPACSEVLPDLERERERVDQAVSDLQAARAVLDTLMTGTLPPGVTGAEDYGTVEGEEPINREPLLLSPASSHSPNNDDGGAARQRWSARKGADDRETRGRELAEEDRERVPDTG